MIQRVKYQSENVKDYPKNFFEGSWVSSCCHNKVPWTGYPKLQKCVSHGSAGWNLRSEYQHGRVSVRVPFLVSEGSFLMVSSRGKERQRKSSHCLLERTLNPSWGSCPHDLIKPNYLPKAPWPNIFTLEGQDSMYELGVRGHDSVQSKKYVNKIA